MESHMYERNCTKKRLNFYVKNVYIWNSTLLYNLENPKNPIMGQPIVAGYNWILKPTSIFVGHHLKSFYSKFENILNDSLSLIKVLGKTKIDNDRFCLQWTSKISTVIYQWKMRKKNTKSCFSNTKMKFLMHTW